MIHLGDITQIDGAKVPIVDVIIGGSPCQDLSIAGKRAGLAGERSGLFMEQIRIVKEMRATDARDNGRTDRYTRPRYMVWENVPGAFSSAGGADFGAVLHEIIKVVEPEAPSISCPKNGWPTAGCLTDMAGKWSVAWRVFDAQFWGVPQRRRRIALVADYGGTTAPEILFERKGLYGDFAEAGGAQKESSADGTKGRFAGAIYCLATQQSGAEVRSDDKAPTLTAAAGMSGNNQPVVCAGFQHKAGAKAHGIGYEEEKAPTLTSEQQCAVNIFGKQVIPTLVSSAFKGPGNTQDGFCVYDARENCVRRLTPLECERLQGFPDGWTDIGAWTDSKGKLHKESSESARYKALGNSIALPPWKWVLKRLCAHYERDATMGSLFDGIGGFPLIWEQLNGRGSCLWASEIEEFCIAVTKRRFGNNNGGLVNDKNFNGFGRYNSSTLVD